MNEQERAKQILKLGGYIPTKKGRQSMTEPGAREGMRELAIESLDKLDNGELMSIALLTASLAGD